MSVAIKRVAQIATVCAVAVMTSTEVSADSSANVPVSARFQQTDGRALYEAICQGCHMADAKGAVGAADYPPLAANKNLQAAGYPIYVVVYGQKAMPSFGGFLGDDQVAAVVDYIRTHFGNDFRDAASARDVKAIRQPGYLYSTLD